MRMMPFGITFTFVSRMHEATAASAIVSPGAAFPAGIHQRHEPWQFAVCEDSRTTRYFPSDGLRTTNKAYAE